MEREFNAGVTEVVRAVDTALCGGEVNAACAEGTASVGTPRAAMGFQVELAEAAQPSDKWVAFVGWIPVRTAVTRAWALIRTGRR